MSALILISNDWKCIGCQCVCVRSTVPVERSTIIASGKHIQKKSCTGALNTIMDNIKLHYNEQTA